MPLKIQTYNIYLGPTSRVTKSRRLARGDGFHVHQQVDRLKPRRSRVKSSHYHRYVNEAGDCPTDSSVKRMYIIK